VLASDCELPFLSRAEPVETPDLELRLTPGTQPKPATYWFRVTSSVIHRTGDGDLILEFADETRFLVNAHLIALLDAPPAYTRDDLAAYALGPALMLALHLQGAVLLHASAVVISGKAVLFAGDSGSGKSTTVAMLHRLGCEVLADDVTEIRGTRAVPSVPTVRLWPDVLDALFGSAAAFPDRAPAWDKKLLRVPAAEEAEIGAILFLEPREGEARLQRLDARSGWMRLMASAQTALLPDRAMQQKIFDVTVALADRVPMFSFAAPPLEEAATLAALLAERLR